MGVVWARLGLVQILSGAVVFVVFYGFGALLVGENESATVLASAAAAAAALIVPNWIGAVSPLRPLFAWPRNAFGRALLRTRVIPVIAFLTVTGLFVAALVGASIQRAQVEAAES